MHARLSLPVLLALAGALPAAAQPEREWSYDRHLAQDIFETELVLSYGVPETDAVQARATCAIGAQAPYVALRLAIAPGPRAEGAGVQVTIRNARGDSYLYQAGITGVGAEVGITGVDLPLATDDPILAEFTEAGPLSYAIPGAAPVTLPLAGIGDKAARLVEDCRDIATLTPDPPALDPATAASAALCDVVQSLRSGTGGAPQPVRFTNVSDGYRVLLWVDFEGNLTEYAALQAGLSYDVNSFVDHVWQVTDGPGNCVQVVTLQPGDSAVSLSAPQRVFEPE
ncbi:hypothetical protein [Pseudoponticoccus marisrubri]|uniref:von Hippel-Lindau disease tumour suppressor beta domain-containing protein n=1 Tax=Pseudoponticoccus marisrubri TaxID=1685382 RepID=A0A0W7WLS0_9RHOB|nr:hypothetical protein [Pseudoponticoccus marisrubri]KUF11503.1 hypothetical protein AVJ23_06995 [Pseudoponticoccus marisrubri]